MSAWRVAGLLATALVAGVGVALAALGFVIARKVTDPSTARRFDLRIRGVERDGERQIVLLDRTPRTAAPGLYNLWLEDGGLVRLSAEVHERGDRLVGREIAGMHGAREVRTGQRVSWSGIYFADPADAGLEAEDVVIETDVGPAPAWLIRGSGEAATTWAIHIHGLGSPRAGTLRGVQVATELGLTSLVVSYRNDGEGPKAGRGRSTLGETETDDVRAALTFAHEQGARRVILFGWSMGAAIALQLAAESQRKEFVAGLILESPVLDWAAAIRANCARAGLPAWTGALALPWLESRPLARLLGLQRPIAVERFDWNARVPVIDAAALLLHGDGDWSSPVESSVWLSGAAGGVVRLETFVAEHTSTWNSDPGRWSSTVRKSIDADLLGRAPQ